MGLGGKRSVATVAAILLILGAHQATAEVQLLWETAQRYYGCDSDGSPQPRRVEILMTVQEDLTGLDQVLILAEYEMGSLATMNTGEPAPTAGRLKAVVRRLQNGKWKKIGKVKAIVFHAEDELWAENLAAIQRDIAPGDLLRWNLTLSGLPPMDEGQWMVLQVGIGK